MIEVLTRGPLNYTMCRLLTQLTNSGEMEKYSLFECNETGRVFIAENSTGCWAEMDCDKLVHVLNDLTDKLELMEIEKQELKDQLGKYEADEYDRQQNF